MGFAALKEKWRKEGEVTLDTPIPEIPKEKVEAPSGDELRKGLKVNDAQMNNMRDEIKRLKEERSKAIADDKKERELQQGNLKSLFKEIKDLNNEIGELNDEK